MIDPIAIGQTKNYIAKCEKGKENPTVWELGALDSMQQQYIDATLIESFDREEDETINVKRSMEGQIRYSFLVVSHGLKGFKNFGELKFVTEKFKFFDHEIDVASMELLKQIPLEIIRELSDEIISANQVNEDLEKN